MKLSSAVAFYDLEREIPWKASSLREPLCNLSVLGASPSTEPFPPSLLARQVYMIFKINPSFVRASRLLARLSACPSVRLSFYRADMERVVWILLHYSCAVCARRRARRKPSGKGREKRRERGSVRLFVFAIVTAETFVSNPQSSSGDQSQLNSSGVHVGGRNRGWS